MPLPAKVTWVTFDVYGTLIDWETGILDAFQREAQREGFTIEEPEKIFPRFLELEHEIESGSYELAPFTPEDIGKARLVVERYDDLGIGLADASIVVLADHYDCNRVLTLDERHFRALRTTAGTAFTLLPADA